MDITTRDIETPLGRYTLAANAEGLTHVQLAGSASLPRASETADCMAVRHLDAAERALRDYFAGARRDFRDLSLAPSGSPFQRRVWQALQEIPFGKTSSYGEIARRVGRERGARAVGAANHHNPLGIVVPCHRVIGSSGQLTGYAGGLSRKQWLLEHEGAAFQQRSLLDHEGAASQQRSLLEHGGAASQRQSLLDHEGAAPPLATTR